MLKVVNYVQIDFSRNKDITVPSIQYDSGTRWVMAKLYNNGVPIDLHDLKVCIMAVKPDGKEVFNSCNVIDPDDGLIKFEITEQMGFVKGEVECQIKLMDQDRLLSSDIFKLNVNKSLSFENSESTNQLTTLVDALYRVEHLDAELSGEFRDSQLEREELFNESQMDREEVFNSSQLNREETFNVSETERENTFDNSQREREELFNDSQVKRENTFNDSQVKLEEMFDASQRERENTFNDSQLNREETFNVSETEREELFNQSQKDREELFNDKLDQFEERFLELKGDGSWVMPSDMVDYMGNQHETLKAKNDADVDWLLGEINTVHYDGQCITATDSIEGRAKSAILSGNTLVNCIIDSSKKGYNNLGLGISIEEDGWITAKATTSNNHFELKMDNLNIKPSTKYLFVFECKSNSFEGSTNNLMIGDTYMNVIDSPWNGQKTIPLLPIGITKFILSTKSDFSSLDNPIGCRSYVSVGSGETKFRYMIIEYQDGMENWDIPYFEGMQSVRMPVLTTSNGGNVINNDMWMIGRLDSTTGGILSGNQMITDFIKKPYNVVEFSTIGGSVYNVIFEYDANKNFIKATGRATNSLVLTLASNTEFIKLNIQNPIDSLETHQPMLTSGGRNELKTNILLTTQDLELRGIGEVRDELDLLTGEVAQHIGEYVLDENITGYLDTNYSVNGYSAFRITSINNIPGSLSNVVCDKVKYYPNINLDWTKQEEFCTSNGSLLFIKLLSTKASTFEELKLFLTSSPITIQYELSEKSIKTVVFKEVDQDGNETVHENGVIVYSHKDTTHYICGSEDSSLIPSLSIDVPTNLPAVVTRQKTMIHELEVENKALIDELQRVEEKSDQADLEQLSTTWEIDYRVSELEWFVEDNISSTMTVAEKINLKLGGNTMALSRFEQAKILILAGAYNRETLEKQLTNYLKRGYLTTEEYDELIALMDAKELVSEN